MCERPSLNQKINSPSENLEKAVNDMKVQNTNVDLVNENIKILQNELPQKNEIIKSLMEIQSAVFSSLSAGRNDKLSKINNNSNIPIIINNNNNNLNNCCNTINRQCMSSTSSKYNKINTLKIYN